jgi:hypothetical protein
MGWVERIEDGLIHVSNRLDNQLRLRDFDLNRVRGGWAQRVFGITGYPAYTILLFFPTLGFLFYGPTWDRWRGYPLLALLTGSIVLSCVLARFLSETRRWLLQGQAILVLVSAALLSVWNYTRPSLATQADDQPYQHVLLLILPLALLFATLLPPFVANRLIRGFKRRHPNYGRRFRLALRRGELLSPPHEIRFSLSAVGQSVLTFPFQKPARALLVPAFAILLVPYHFMEYAGILAFLLNAFLFGLGGVHPRLHAMLSLADRVFFFGGQWCLSLVVIVLAICRIADYSYVSIVLNSINNNALLFFLFCAYCTLWLYETWLHFVLCERLLPLLNGGKTRTASWIDYSLRPSASLPTAKPDHRNIQILGARYVAVGPATSPAGELCFEMYEKLDLFQTLATRAYPNIKASTLERIFGLSELASLVQTYFALLNSCLLLLVAMGWFCARPDTIPVRILNLFHLAHIDNTVPELTINGSSYAVKRGDEKHAEPPMLVTHRYQGLRQDLFGAPSGGRQVVFVAASGGGTRAALYAASLFHGLARLDALQHTRLVSGVSGGSAAIAYLAVHQHELLENPNPEAWNAYFDVMAHPYIDDVIRGCAEMRLLLGTRTGTLLAESFARTMVGSRVDLPILFGEVNFGIIFNSTIGGQAAWSGSRWELPERELAGDKMVITNAVPRSAFPSQGFVDGSGSMRDQYLHFEYLNNPNIHLTDAAALSANFPPVFPDALVRVEGEKESWVTDGGASENRGLVALLYALESALREQLAQNTASRPPRIHILIAEASAISRPYTLDRGVGAAIASAGKCAEQVATDHLQEISRLYEKLGGNPDDLNVWYLPMPDVFVEGGIATHWMMPSIIQLRNTDPDGRKHTIVMTGRLTQHLVADLHRLPEEPWSIHARTLGVEDLNRVESWLDADFHRAEWTRFVNSWRSFK